MAPFRLDQHVATVRGRVSYSVTRFLGALDSQNIIEFGSYRGGSALFMGALLKERFPKAKLFALDTYEGMPPTDKSRDHHGQGAFSDADFEGFVRRIVECGLSNTVIPVRGRFDQSFPQLERAGLPRFGLAHFDADIYEATKYAQHAVWPHMTKGGYLVYDDATASSCLGAMEAVEDLIVSKGVHAEQVFPHFVFRAGLEAA
jgi:hypothetical protein